MLSLAEENSFAHLTGTGPRPLNVRHSSPAPTEFYFHMGPVVVGRQPFFLDWLL